MNGGYECGEVALLAARAVPLGIDSSGVGESGRRDVLKQLAQEPRMIFFCLISVLVIPAQCLLYSSEYSPLSYLIYHCPLSTPPGPSTPALT